MRVTAVEKLEDCFDGSLVFRWHLDQPWQRETIQALERAGRLHYYPDFPRPYFRLRTASGMEMRGVEGETACRIIFPSRQAASDMAPIISALFPDMA